MSSDLELLANAFVGFERAIQNNLYAREAFLRRLMDPRRDIDDECGHPKGPISANDYQELYDRDGISTRAIEVFSKECFQVLPNIYEVEDPDIVTPFEADWYSLGDQLRGQSSWLNEDEASFVCEYLQRVDILSGIGRYGIILLGVDDGKDLSEPLLLRTRDGTTDISPRKLLYLRCFPETLAQITKVDDDNRSPRYGQPVEYLITLNDPREGVPGGVIGTDIQTRTVHWTRVVHIADNVGSSEVFGVPRLQPILNNVQDLRKLYGGSAEMYYKGAFPGISFETHPEMGGEVKITDTKIKDMVENYFNSLQRYLLTWGMTAKSLAPQVVDPTPQIRVQIEAICIRLGIPKRVFMGSERGELSSMQDDAAWNDRLRHRHRTYLTPRLVAPFIDRLIAIGVLRVPNYKKGDKPEYFVRGKKKGTRRSGYCVEWPDIESQTETERTNNAAKITQAMMQYVTGNVQTMMSPKDFFTYVLSLSPRDAEAIVIRAKKLAEEMKTNPAAGTSPPATGIQKKPDESGQNNSPPKGTGGASAE